MPVILIGTAAFELGDSVVAGTKFSPRVGLGVFIRASSFSSSFGVGSRAGTAGLALKESPSLFFFLFKDACLDGVFEDGCLAASGLLSCTATFVDDG